MSYLIIFHPVADKEYNDAYQWYEDRLEGLGERFSEAIGNQLNQIVLKPLLYPKNEALFVRRKLIPFLI